MFLCLFCLYKSHPFLWDHFDLRTAMVLDGAIFTVGGALWFYALGFVISKVIGKVTGKGQATLTSH